MTIYLPIAGMTENIFLLLGLGGGIGILSGLFGVGGGFLLTPLLIMMGIPPAVAVGTSANQVLGSSVSGAMAHWRRRAIDLKMGFILLVGGLVGSTSGVSLFSWLRTLGQIELVVNLCYVLLLGTIGTLMLVESVNFILRRRAAGATRRKLHAHNWMHGLPLKTRFPRSKLYISVIPPLLIGLAVGLLSAVMGVGGGFIMIPAMIYLLQMPTDVVVGTSLFQIIFVTASVTFMQATANQGVDILLTLLLLIGGVIGAQVGAKMGRKLRGDQLRLLLALLVLAMAIKLLFDVTLRPDELYSLATEAR